VEIIEPLEKPSDVRGKLKRIILYLVSLLLLSNTAGFLLETPCSELFIKSVNSYKRCCYFIGLFESLEVIDIYINSTIIGLC